MDRSTVSSSAVKCMFLGSKDKLIVAGDAPNANVQILYSHEGGGDGDALQTAAELDFHGHCTDLELCGIARLAQTYGAIALWEPLKGKSSLSLFNIDTQLDHASMQELPGSLYNDTCAISSITFSPDMEFLAVGTEAGLVSILDIHSGKALSTFKVDPCGVAKVKFMRTGQLITVGESPKAQIKIWDLRAAAGMDGDSGVAMVLSQELSSERGAVPSRATCVCAHPVHEKLVSGTSSGEVHLWDLRSAASLVFRPHPFAAVSDVLVHPRRLHTVLSSAADGTVRYFDSTTARTHSHGGADGGAGSGEEVDEAFPVLCADASAVTSMDCDNSTETCTLAASTSAGGIIRIAI